MEAEVPARRLGSFAQSRFITIIVGAEESKYTAHQEILVAKCPFFATCLTAGMIEASSGEVRLPEDSPEAFGYFIDWVYYGKVQDIGDDTEKVTLAMEAWVLADKFCMPEWQDQLMDQILQYVRIYVIEPAMVAWVVDKLETTSLLHQFIMDQLAWDQVHSEDVYTASSEIAIRAARAEELKALLDRKDFPHAELRQSTLECARASRQAQVHNQKGQLNPPAKNPCKYHVHEQGTPCKEAKA
ncbi:Transmembrane emp24 domain-containing protein 10 [Exophiala xenobiotica]|nr:Transmembrane emp24 domain-containing protein 10 [Exophiala xenobiotica]KAK5296212.1 Transmembrane emp24 domain-containing protein 10 [Exophiala xenobiotica]KAK5472472.1 Transmembrane emp24 domain-containing protein 10 [Exophiala xenobiotica]